MASDHYTKVSAWSSPEFKRRERRLLIQKRDKKLIKLDKELDKIWKEKQNLGFKPLTPPIQRGWKRTFVLREDIKRSVNAEFFQQLLDKVNNVQYSHRRDFKQKKKRKGRKVQVERIQELHSINDFTYARLTEKEKKYFRKEIGYDAVKKHEKTVRYIFIHPWKFRLKVFPHMITEIKIVDPLLEQRIAQIDDYLERNRLRPRLCWLTEGYYQYKDRWHPAPIKPKYTYILDQDFIRKEIQEYHIQQEMEKRKRKQWEIIS